MKISKLKLIAPIMATCSIAPCITSCNLFGSGASAEAVLIDNNQAKDFTPTITPEQKTFKSNDEALDYYLKACKENKKVYAEDYIYYEWSHQYIIEGHPYRSYKIWVNDVDTEKKTMSLKIQETNTYNYTVDSITAVDTYEVEKIKVKITYYQYANEFALSANYENIDKFFEDHDWVVTHKHTSNGKVTDSSYEKENYQALENMKETLFRDLNIIYVSSLYYLSNSKVVA